MRIIIIGAVAAGTSVAAKARRNSEQAEIIVYEKDTRVPKQYEKGHVPGAINIPHEQFREQLKFLDPTMMTITYCNKGVTGNATQNILINAGFQDVYSISGGYRTFKARYDKHISNTRKDSRHVND